MVVSRPTDHFRSNNHSDVRTYPIFSVIGCLKHKPAEEVISIIHLPPYVCLIAEIKRLGVEMHLFILAALMASAMAGPTLYNIDKEAGTAERVMKEIM